MKQEANICAIRLAEHCKEYPKLQMQDIFKYIFQSTFGCEHMVSDEEAVLEYIKREYATVPKDAPALTEPLDGNYSRVWLSWLNRGLSPSTLARLFCLSARKEKGDLEERLEAVRQLISDGAFPFDCSLKMLDDWMERGCPAVHHSDAFRAEYKPAYRVISNKYTPFLQLFAEIDILLSRGDAVVAIEGGSASGKSTLGDILLEVYGCNLFHTDDFFLRPEQRTRERLAEVGGNLDRERFFAEVITSLNHRREVTYRPYSCGLQRLGDSITLPHNRLTVVEGVYSMHPAFGEYYSLAVFMSIDKPLQRERVLKRNPELASRFFNTWIPLEDNYFLATNVRSRAHLVISIKTDI